jgi:adenine-specific DNA-methyltransferase
MTLLHGDCLEVMRGMEADSIDLIAVDPPYFKVKGDAWDRQWDKPDAFLAWIGQLCEQWQRLLKPNGSLYCFASPRMAARVECKIAERFGVLNRIRWVKSAGWHQKAEKETLRSFLSPWEEIIFAEHYGADNMAKGEAGYAAKCDELRGFVFEPLRAYLDGERDRAGVSVRQVAEAFQRKTGSRTVTGMAGHWFGQVQWALPTQENYEWLRATLANLNHNGEYLRRDYEYLRRDYEELRRPFSVSADVPYTDVWDFPTVSHRPGKHPCEKPLAMMEHIIRSSSREGATVLDCCMGGGTTGEACINLNRRFIGIENDDGWYAAARRRLLERQELLVA